MWHVTLVAITGTTTLEPYLLIKSQQLISQRMPNLQMSYRLDYCHTYNISCTFVGNIVVDHSDVDGASPDGAAPTTSSFST